MPTHDHNSPPTDPPSGILSWAFDDEDAPTEITIFDPQKESTTHWITSDRDDVCALAECV